VTSRTIHLTDDLHAYLVAHGSEPDPVVRDLIVETHSLLPDQAIMQIAPEQARFLTLLTKLLGVRRAVEVGTFTGLSALSIARGLTEGGSLICCDVSAEFTAVAQRYWARAGVADQIDLRLGPAEQTLAGLPAERSIDLSFIDADKVSYPVYWNELVTRTRSGGVILVDNVLMDGDVLDPDSSVSARAVDTFNKDLLTDDRVEIVMLPMADGLTLARVR